MFGQRARGRQTTKIELEHPPIGCPGKTSQGWVRRTFIVSADLTQLAGPDGKIPMTRVMSKIWGYTRAPDGTLMPRFAPLLESDQMVLFDSGDGIPTPTPRRLVQLAEYLQTIQAK